MDILSSIRYILATFEALHRDLQDREHLQRELTERSNALGL